jgi:Na+-transporting NADH:ubiquinone oxidoreductase subunit NqrF
MWRNFTLFIIIVVAIIFIYSLSKSSFVKDEETQLKNNLLPDLKTTLEKGLDDTIATFLLLEVRSFLIGAGSLFLFLMSSRDKKK